MTRLLRDPAAQHHVESEGFVVVRLFSQERVTHLRSLFDRYISASEVAGLYESSRNQTYEVNRSINDAIQAQVAAAGADIFMPSRIYGGTFMVKSHTDSAVLPLHQDWSVVEEAQYATLFVWCPLEDVSVLNGGLFVLPRSHRWFASLRSGSYPSDRFVLPAQLHGCVQDIALKAGEAILYSDALFHGSHANNGSRPRIIVTARVVEHAAPLVYFHKSSETEVDVYQASPEFYLTHIDSLAKGRMPAGVPMLYRRPYTHVPVTGEALEARTRFSCGVRGDTMPMNQLFKEPALQSQFDREGFVVIDLIDDGQVDALKTFYAGLHNAPTPQHGFQVSLDNESADFVRRVSERLQAAVEASVDTHFTNHQIITGSFVTKAKNPLGVVPPHQDWTFVDESRFWSATIWCPLVDVNVDNGALALLKGSHLLYDHVRPSPSPQYAPPFKDQLLTIFPYMTVVPLRAGQAVVFNNQTLHASAPNTTTHTRLAFGVGVTHRDARLRHYYLLPGQSEPLVEGYEVTPEFFFGYNNARLSALHARGERPTGLNSFGTFAVRSAHYSASELVEKMRAAGNREDRTLLERVAVLSPDYRGAGGVDTAGRAMTRARPARSDNRPLWKVYTPANIVREIRYKLTRQ